MPEGPEARVIADKLRPLLTEKFIIKLEITERAKIVGNAWLTSILPIKIINVRTHGKKVIFDLETGHIIVASLGMTGKYLYSPGKHTHIRFDIGDVEKRGILNVVNPIFSLYFDDTRNFGNIAIGDITLLSELDRLILEETSTVVWLPLV